jgi:two-component sensor histidine kinase
MQRALAPKGIAIEHVANADDALELLRGGGYRAVALDHDLGATTGLQVLREIRAIPDAPPVIYVTGSDDVRVAVAALKAGAVDYVWKDVEGHYRDLLIESIGAALMQETLKREKERAERDVLEAKERAEMLLSEVNHRVANSLALVAALTRMQANAIDDAGTKAVLQDMQARINAIAGIHRRLYTSPDVRFVDMDDYVSSLVQELDAAMSAEQRKHEIRLDVEAGIRIATDKAVSIGVVMTELITNAYKYAYPGKTDGDIRVALRRIDSKHMRLAVEDDGIGWTGAGEVQGTGIGSRVIKAMATNLKSTVTYDPAHSGTRVVMEFAA